MAMELCPAIRASVQASHPDCPKGENPEIRLCRF